MVDQISSKRYTGVVTKEMVARPSTDQKGEKQYFNGTLRWTNSEGLLLSSFPFLSSLPNGFQLDPFPVLYDFSLGRMIAASIHFFPQEYAYFT